MRMTTKGSTVRSWKICAVFENAFFLLFSNFCVNGQHRSRELLFVSKLTCQSYSALGDCNPRPMGYSIDTVRPQYILSSPEELYGSWYDEESKGL